MYLCRNCLHQLKTGGRGRACPACSTPVTSAHSTFVLAAFALVIVAGLFFAIFAYSFLSDSAIQATPRATLPAATPGATVHVAGQILSAYGQQVLWAHYVHAGKSSHWDYYGSAFTITALNSSLQVDATQITTIYTAPHVSNGGDDLTFVAGDHVELIGTVTSVFGVPTLEAQYAALGPTDFLPASEGWIALVSGSILFALAAAALWLEAIGIYRARAHVSNTTGANSFQYRIPTAPSPEVVVPS